MYSGDLPRSLVKSVDGTIRYAAPTPKMMKTNLVKLWFPGKANCTV